MKRRMLFAAVMVAALPALATGALADADLKKGKRVFNKCKACHEASEAKNKVGPSLLGLFGRKAGAVEGFNYSDAMKNSGIVWDEETLAKYLADPKGFIPDNKMVFAGLNKEDDIENVIAFLKEETAQ